MLKQNRQTIFLMGASPMVEELGEQCLRANYNVIIRLNNAPKKKALPSGMRTGSAIPTSVTIAIELTNTEREKKRSNLLFLEKHISRRTTILSSSVNVTALEQSTWLKSPERLIGIAALPTLLSKKLLEIAPSIHTSTNSLSSTQNFFKQLGKEVVVVQDRVGMVLPRILCMLINEASFALMENVAHPQDIDTAMKLGTNYPFGPIEWADKIGIPEVISVLEALYGDLKEERYRIAPLLRQLGTGKAWWPT